MIIIILVTWISSFIVLNKNCNVIHQRDWNFKPNKILIQNNMPFKMRCRTRLVVITSSLFRSSCSRCGLLQRSGWFWCPFCKIIKPKLNHGRFVPVEQRFFTCCRPVILECFKRIQWSVCRKCWDVLVRILLVKILWSSTDFCIIYLVTAEKAADAMLIVGGCPTGVELAAI